MSQRLTPRLLATARALARRWWSVPRLRWLLFGTLLFVAALPGVAALGLRVYENALVRRTEAEVVAQGAALAASAALLWPGARTSPALAPPDEPVRESYEDISTGIDLRYSPVLADRPAARPVAVPPDPDAVEVARHMAPALAETKRATLASLILLDRAGVVLNGRDRGRSLAHVPEVRAALRGEVVTALRRNDAYAWRYPLEWVSRATNIRLHQARPIVVDGKVAGAILVSRSPRALFRGMWEDRGKIAVGIAAIFALLIALTAILARAIIRPVERLSHATRLLAHGQNARPRRPTLEVREIAGLYDDFAAMSAAIARRSRYLRDFAAALSHEFKTPLAGIRGGIELLQDHGPGMAEAERTRFLGNMATDADRLSRLVSRLMELAQADMRAADPEARADLAVIIARVADAQRGDDFAIHTQLPATLPLVAIDPAGLETVLATLVENARQSGADALRISAEPAGRFLEIRLVDNGPGVPIADRERVFDPFFTSKRAHGGTGLGLPIARSLLENGRGWLELEVSESGACFVLGVPVASDAAIG